MKDLENELLCMSVDGYKGKHDDMIDAEAHLFDMLSPGDSGPKIPLDGNSWEAAYNQARAHLTPWDFFKE